MIANVYDVFINTFLFTFIKLAYLFILCLCRSVTKVSTHMPGLEHRRSLFILRNIFSVFILILFVGFLAFVLHFQYLPVRVTIRFVDFFSNFCLRKFASFRSTVKRFHFKRIRFITVLKRYCSATHRWQIVPR